MGSCGRKEGRGAPHLGFDRAHLLLLELGGQGTRGESGEGQEGQFGNRPTE